MNMKKSVYLTKELLNIRDSARALFGDQYKHEVRAWMGLIREWAIKDKKPAIDVAIEMAKILEAAGDRKYSTMLLWSGLVEEIEGSFPSTRAEGSQVGLSGVEGGNT